jgi:hypothetical protein
MAFVTDDVRDGLGYPATWQSFHCELVDPTNPAVMDDYTRAGDALNCRHDAISRPFLVDRIVAKVGR